MMYKQSHGTLTPKGGDIQGKTMSIYNDVHVADDRIDYASSMPVQ